MGFFVKIRGDFMRVDGGMLAMTPMVAMCVQSCIL